jgi:hypothetical protein
VTGAPSGIVAAGFEVCTDRVIAIESRDAIKRGSTNQFLPWIDLIAI